MAIRRITISVPEEVAGRIRRAAGGGPVSTWATGLIEDYLNDAELERQWDAFIRDLAPQRGHVRRADAIFRRLSSRKRRGP
jgi:hypothetical protein